MEGERTGGRGGERKRDRMEGRRGGKTGGETDQGWHGFKERREGERRERRTERTLSNFGSSWLSMEQASDVNGTAIFMTVDYSWLTVFILI